MAAVVPSPASFENTPRLKPVDSAVLTAYPAVPPANCLMPNAPQKICSKAEGSASIFEHMRKTDAETYHTDISGRNTLQNFAPRSLPEKRHAPAKTAITAAVAHVGTESSDSSALDAMLPIPKEAATVSAA